MNHKNAKKKSNHSFSWEICLAILLQSSAALPWNNGVLPQKRWKVKMQKWIKWGIEKDLSVPLLLQKTDMNLFSLDGISSDDRFSPIRLRYINYGPSVLHMERPWKVFIRASLGAFELKSSLKSCKLKFEGSFQVKFPHRSRNSRGSFPVISLTVHSLV